MICCFVQVYETDEEHRSTITQLKERLVVLEAEAGRHQEVLDSTTAHNKQQIEKLYQDKALLEVTSFSTLSVFAGSYRGNSFMYWGSQKKGRFTIISCWPIS